MIFFIPDKIQAIPIPLQLLQFFVGNIGCLQISQVDGSAIFAMAKRTSWEISNRSSVFSFDKSKHRANIGQQPQYCPNANRKVPMPQAIPALLIWAKCDELRISSGML